MMLAGTGICVMVSDMVSVIVISMFDMTMADMLVSCMSGMVMTELTCGEGGDEDRQTAEHDDALPTVVAGLLDSAFGLARNDIVGRSLARSDSVVTCLAVMLTGVLVEFESLAVGLDSAVFVVVLIALFRVLSVVDLVYYDADNDS